MAQNAAQSSNSPSQAALAAQGQGPQADENTRLLEQIASLVASVKELAERSDSTSGSQPPASGTSTDEVFQEQVEFAYNLLGSMLGRTTFDSKLVTLPVKRESKALVFLELRGATAARVRARVNGIDEVVAFDNLSNGQKVPLALQDGQAIDGIEILDSPGGAVVALGRIEK